MVGALVTALSGVAAGAIVGSGAAAAQPACPKMYVVAIPGTWETSNRGHAPGPGMLADATDGLPDDIQVQYIRYAATAFPWEGEVYGRSRTEAINRARSDIAGVAARCDETKFGIIGYSQGADAAGDLAAEIGTGRGVVPPSRVAAVGLLSDPSRSPIDIQVGPRAGGAGAEGPRPGGFGWLTPVTRTICAPTDLYCATAGDDYATRFAGFLTQMSDLNPAKIWSYQEEFGSIMGDLMNGGGVRLLQSQFTDAANARRAKELQHFYGSGVHNDYGWYNVAPGVTADDWLRNYLIRQAG
jgi:hypothetical protein